MIAMLSPMALLMGMLILFVDFGWPAGVYALRCITVIGGQLAC